MQGTLQQGCKEHWSNFATWSRLKKSCTYLDWWSLGRIISLWKVTSVLCMCSYKHFMKTQRTRGGRGGCKNSELHSTLTKFGIANQFECGYLLCTSFSAQRRRWRDQSLGQNLHPLLHLQLSDLYYCRCCCCCCCWVLLQETSQQAWTLVWRR